MSESIKLSEEILKMDASDYDSAQTSPSITASSSCSSLSTVKKLDSDCQLNLKSDDQCQSLLASVTTNPCISRKEISESNLYQLNLAEGLMNLKDVSKKDENIIKSPDDSKNKTKSTSVFSIFKKIFKSTSDTNSETNEITTQKDTLTVNNEDLTVSSVAIASASSPNPDCSPYKLLDNNFKQFNTSLNNNKIIENLTNMNNADIERIDAILSPNPVKSSTSTSSSSASSSPANVSQNSNSPVSELVTSTSSLNSTTTTSAASSITMQVPATSRDFCMGLNFNLAAAAAASAPAPVFVVDNSKSPKQSQPQHCLDNNRFTSNASTSSIHNDLKLILEESKVKKSPQSDKSTSSSPEAPKPQRNTQSPKSQHTKISPQIKTEIKEELTTSPTSTPAVKNTGVNLIKALMVMLESNKNKKDGEEAAAVSMADWSKENLQQDGHYRYSKVI